MTTRLQSVKETKFWSLYWTKLAQGDDHGETLVNEFVGHLGETTDSRLQNNSVAWRSVPRPGVKLL